MPKQQDEVKDSAFPVQSLCSAYNMPAISSHRKLSIGHQDYRSCFKVGSGVLFIQPSSTGRMRYKVNFSAKSC